MNNRINQKLARKAALLFARGNWGDIYLDGGTAIYEMGKKTVGAYVFLIAFEPEKANTTFLVDTIIERTKSFTEAWKNHQKYLGKKADPQLKQKNRKEFEKERKKLFQAEDYGTIVIRTRRDRHPIMMAYQGLPFTLTSPGIIYHLNVKGFPSQKMEAVRFSIPEGDGYPHFYGEFNFGGKRRKKISLMDFRSTFKKPEFTRPPLKLSKQQHIEFAKKWKLIEKMPFNYLEKVTPTYLSSLKNEEGFISGVPDLSWDRGCAPTAAANILAYWDDRGYSRLVDDEVGKDENDLIDELAGAMDTDSDGNTKDKNVSDGIQSVCNGYNNNYDFDVKDPSSSKVWIILKYHISHLHQPCLMILHGHETYGDHAVTVIGYSEIINGGCVGEGNYLWIHDTWPNIPGDIRIPYLGSIDQNDEDSDWKLVRVYPGTRYVSTQCMMPQDIAKEANRQQLNLFRYLAAGNQTHPLCKGFREVYQNQMLTEEFNEILSHSRIYSALLIREISFANLLGRAVSKEINEEKLFFSKRSAKDLKKALRYVWEKASPKLGIYLKLIAKGLDAIAEKTITEIRKELFPQNEKPWKKNQSGMF